MIPGQQTFVLALRWQLGEVERGQTVRQSTTHRITLRPRRVHHILLTTTEYWVVSCCRQKTTRLKLLDNERNPGSQTYNLLLDQESLTDVCKKWLIPVKAKNDDGRQFSLSVNWTELPTSFQAELHVLDWGRYSYLSFIRQFVTRPIKYRCATMYLLLTYLPSMVYCRHFLVHNF